MNPQDIKEWLQQLDARMRRLEIANAVVIGLVITQAGTGLLGLLI